MMVPGMHCTVPAGWMLRLWVAQIVLWESRGLVLAPGGTVVCGWSRGIYPWRQPGMAARWKLPGQILGLGCRVSVRGLTVASGGRCGAAWDGDCEGVSDEQLHALKVAFCDPRENEG